MVTLLGFLFIIANVALLEIFIPDLVGPVRNSVSSGLDGPSLEMLRHTLGSVLAVL